ncbi:hypothetical protein [Cyanobium sp. Cruz-8H5]|uniref:hypothetical protein n=1 Tax=Cyanobium sp. Cruz-8H5 TaxID=2823712 RepID=UPI0020CD17F8|nr:hypothetical protein [Cyanobium sp. Cruz-8H5]MCP9861406.1 hypothetical protein [Cyanobium sp. Cruz-8H5]
MCFRTSFVAAVLIASGFCASSTFAQANENAIRQADQNTVVIGYEGRAMRFTVEGRPSDVILVRFSSNELFTVMTLRQFSSSPLVRAVEHASNGDLRLRVEVQNPQLSFKGGSVEIRRNGVQVDNDAINIRR